jgi:hypothetical protein
VTALPDGAGGPQPAPNRAEQARLAVFWRSVAAAATDRAAALTGDLEAQARAEYDRDGSAPTWRIPGVGTVPFTLSSDRVDVADEAAYTAWVATRYPTEVVTRVRPTFDEQLRKQLAKRGEPLCDDEGTVIPGLRFVPGGTPRGIQLRPTTEARADASAIANAYLDAMPHPLPGSAT